MDEIDHEYTDEIVCPWCGHKYEASHELFEGHQTSTKDDCQECGKPFHVECEYSVTYNTKKIGA